MAAEGGPTSDPLAPRLIKEGERFSFFQLVKLLEGYYRPEAQVGHQGPASKEVLRFRPDNSMAFPRSDVVKVERLAPTEAQPDRFRVTTSFMGLYGTTSPLPFFYTDETLRRDPEEDTVRAFVDLFHHRLLSLFYRAWTKYRYHTQFEEGGADLFSSRMFSLIGLGTKDLVHQTRLPAERLIRFAGLLTQRTRSASALEGLLSDFFDGVPIQVVPFVERWAPIQPAQQLRLGKANCRLGTDASVGDRVMDRAGQFRIVLGPMGFDAFTRFLPDGEWFKMMESLVILFLQDRLEFNLELQLRGMEVPPLQLSGAGPARLGWTTWLPGRTDGDRVRSVALGRGEGRG
jgi:type VI secretion system protein ImpH